MKFFRDVENILIPLGYRRVDVQNGEVSYAEFIEKSKFPFIRRICLHFYPSVNESTKWRDGLLCNLEVAIAVPQGSFEHLAEEDTWFQSGISVYVTRFGIISPSQHYPKWQLGEETAFTDALTSKGLVWLNDISQYANHQAFCEKLWKDGELTKYYGEPFPVSKRSTFARLVDKIFPAAPLQEASTATVHPPYVLAQLAYSAFWHRDFEKCAEYLRTYFENVNQAAKIHEVESALLRHVELLLGATKK